MFRSVLAALVLFSATCPCLAQPWTRFRGPNGTGVSDVTIALYSAELGSAGQPLLIGLGKSTSGGEFVIPIPTAN